MDTDQQANREIVEILSNKSNMKSLAFDKIQEVFNELKELLGEISSDLDEALDELRDSNRKLSKRVKLVYRDRGKFDAELRFADDVLIFGMLPDIYKFDPTHPIYSNQNYTAKDYSPYCGVINIYNFLYESVKFERSNDYGYLIARVFINADGHFFVEGKGRNANTIERFGSAVINREELKKIVENAMLYSLSFDLLVTPYKDVQSITLSEMNLKIESANLKSGKLYGFDYDISDVIK